MKVGRQECCAIAIFSSLPFVSAYPNPKAISDFNNPPATARVFFRYWFPDASVDPELVAQDIEDAGKIGAGGFELLPFYNYGGEMGKYPVGADWSTYGFGTPAFKEVFKRALEAHKDNAMVMDFAIGPNQGQGVPAPANDEGLQWDLVPFAVPVNRTNGHNSTIKLPGWATGSLIAAISATAFSVKNVSSLPVHTEITVRDGSLQDITAQVDKDGNLSGLNSATEEPAKTWIFAFYQTKTLAKNIHFPNDEHLTIWDNGSYTVDHFSKRGAETVIEFWEKHILTDGIDELLSQVGNYGWEDSLEITSNISWTKNLPESFQTQHGYDVRPYLPLIMFENNNLNIQKDNPGQIKVVLDTLDGGSGYVNAFRATLQRGYQEYLSTLSEWTNERLGCGMSAQTCYNMPMDAASTVPFVDVPECESLQWNNNIDGYRQFSGAATLAGKHVLSNEMGAGYLKAFQHPIPALLDSIHKAFAGGVNRMVIHGYTYAHKYYETTWPGYTAWHYVVSEPYSNKHPSFKVGLKEALDYVGRTQYILQSGIARVDIAVYNKVSASNANFPTVRNSTDFLQAGYSYNYVTSDNFELPTAEVKNLRLAPDTAAYKALIIAQESNNISADAARHLIRFAEQGLPIIVEGDVRPFHFGNESDSGEVEQLLMFLYRLPSVRRCDKGEILAALQTSRVGPRVFTSLNATVNTVWRDDTQQGISYLYVFAENNAATGIITVEEDGCPYIFDAWTGEIRALLHYSRKSNKTQIEIPLRLAVGEALILGFSKHRLDRVPVPEAVIEKMPQEVMGINLSPRRGLVLKMPFLDSPEGSNASIVLSNGHIHHVPSTSGHIRPPFELKSWDLSVEHWEAPTDLQKANVIAVKRNSSHVLTSPLQSWTALGSELVNASGIGYYNASFDWGGNATHDGAYLSFTATLHALKVIVNGNPAPPVDPSNSKIDIGAYMRPGRNDITVVVPTTMWNYLRTFGTNIRSSGAPPFHVYASDGEPRILSPPPASENGLVGTVTVTPYWLYYLEA